jgi:hypothetical protein
MLRRKTLSAGHKFARQLRDRFFPDSEILTVPRIDSAPAGQCYRNARLAQMQVGVGVQLGWLLCYFPGHFLEALHHAVVVARDGRLGDITGSAFPGADYKSIAFIIDGDTPFGKLDPMLPSKFIQLDAEPATTDYIRLTVKRQELARSMNDLASRYFPMREGAPGLFGFQIDPTLPAASRLHALKRERDFVCERRNRYMKRMSIGDFRTLR